MVFEKRGKPEFPEKNLSEQSREPINSAHMTPGLGIEPGTHWWKASALTTAPTLLLMDHSCIHPMKHPVQGRFHYAKIPEFSVGSQMETCVLVWSDRNIQDHLWRWFTIMTGQTEIYCSNF